MKKKSHLGKSWDRERQWILNTQKYWMNFISQSWNVNVWRAQTDLKDVTSVLEMRVFVFINFQPVFLSLHTTACVVAAWERACVCCVKACAHISHARHRPKPNRHFRDFRGKTFRNFRSFVFWFNGGRRRASPLKIYAARCNVGINTAAATRFFGKQIRRGRKPLNLIST